MKIDHIQILLNPGKSKSSPLGTPAKINTSTPQHLNTSTPQHLNTSTPQHLNTSTPHHLNTSSANSSTVAGTFAKLIGGGTSSPKSTQGSNSFIKSVNRFTV